MASDKHRVIHFSVDGKAFETTDSDQVAASVLRQAGLDAKLYDLAEVRGGSDPHVFKDADKVHIHDGARFVSIRQRAEVA